MFFIILPSRIQPGDTDIDEGFKFLCFANFKILSIFFKNKIPPYYSSKSSILYVF